MRCDALRSHGSKNLLAKVVPFSSELGKLNGNLFCALINSQMLILEFDWNHVIWCLHLRSCTQVGISVSSNLTWKLHTYSTAKHTSQKARFPLQSPWIFLIFSSTNYM